MNKIKNSYFPMILKYIFPIVFMLMAFFNHRNVHYIIIEALELLAIISLTNLFLPRLRFAQLLNNIFMLLFNIQLAVLFFGNTYISMIMLSNLHSLEDLEGKIVVYLFGVLLVLIFSFLPIKEINIDGKTGPILLAVFLGAEIVLGAMSSFTYSPLFSYYDIARQFLEIQHMKEDLRKEITLSEEESNALLNKYYKDGIAGYVDKDAALVEKPNVIVIFTEGLSQNVISDERIIMPNVAAYQQKSLSFENYYNHTAATYRGIAGQLSSGYQLEDFDGNDLTSLEDIFSDQGYNTFFFNTEPFNADWTNYVNNLEFDHVVIDSTTPCNGAVNTISDKDAYEILFITAEQQAQTNEPFFMAIYTFGTHATLDSVNEKYGDGTDPALNKFYDVDYQFGLFMEKFENSPLMDNTIVIFTADHATYHDSDFSNAFPEYYREGPFLDEIPFFIYYKGITPDTVDANGRNSLDFAPTIMDYLDLSAPNYFLGTSLFAPEASSYVEHFFTETYVYLSSQEDDIQTPEYDELKVFKTFLKEYFYVKSHLESGE